jgi:hypothetical protein
MPTYLPNLQNATREDLLRGREQLAAVARETRETLKEAEGDPRPEARQAQQPLRELLSQIEDALVVVEQRLTQN